MSPGSVLIRGTGGVGKSALVHEVVGKALEGFREEPSRPLPVLLNEKGESLEAMAAKKLGPALLAPEYLTKHLEAGDFFLVLDGANEIGLSAEALAAFRRVHYSRTTALLIGSRPDVTIESAIERIPGWMIAEPLPLDDSTLDVFVRHYGGEELSNPLKRACRGTEGTYLPILARMAMTLRADPEAGTPSVADIYREHFLRLFENGQADPVMLLKRAARWCVETYWIDGERHPRYKPTDLQDLLLDAGILVRIGQFRVPERVRFFHDSMQSYLTAYGLGLEDETGYGGLPRIEGDGDRPWGRRRVLLRAAADPKFAKDRAELFFPDGSELLQMCFATFTTPGVMRKWLSSELHWFATEHEQNLTRRDILAAIPAVIAGKFQGARRNRDLLIRAANRC